MTTNAQERAIALGAVRACMRARGISPETASVQDAERVLDDLYQTDKHLVAAQWYERATSEQASDNQMRLFAREWRAWQRQTRSMHLEHA